MSNPELAHEHPTIDITLVTILDELPDGPPCMICGEPTERSYVEYVYHGRNSVVIRAKQVPGYKCLTDCDFSSYSHQGMHEALVKVRDILLQKGDESAAKQLEEAILLREKIIAEERLTMPWLYLNHASK